jgi:Flp pilus assembly protein TadG
MNRTHSICKLKEGRRARQKGSSLVESCLCFLGFVVLSLGTMEFCMAVYAYNFVSYAARDASRYASVHGSQSETVATNSDIQTYVYNEAVALNRNLINVNTTWDPDKNPGSQVRVTVAYSIVPLVGIALGRNNLQVSSSSQTVITH